MSSLTHKALATLPPELQKLVKQHNKQFSVDGLDDLISEAFIALAKSDASDTWAQVFGRARSNMRRFECGRIVPPGVLDDDEPTPLRRRDITTEVAARLNVSRRRAQQIIKKALEDAQAGGNGDMFFGRAL